MRRKLDQLLRPPGRPTLIPCAILGDSLAAGVAAFRHDCLIDATVGITSDAYAAGHVMRIETKTALISLGVNDGQATVATADHLVHLRSGVTAERVYWLLPARSDSVRRLIRLVAAQNGDWLIETRGFTGPEGLHLTADSYRAISMLFDLQRPP